MERLKSKQEIEEVFQTGTWQNHALLKLLIKSYAQRDQLGRVAFIAGKKTGGAVQRNKAKRMMREAFRTLNIEVAADIILVATTKTKSSDIVSLHIVLEKLLRRAGLYE